MRTRFWLIGEPSDALKAFSRAAAALGVLLPCGAVQSSPRHLLHKSLHAGNAEYTVQRCYAVARPVNAIAAQNKLQCTEGAISAA